MNNELSVNVANLPTIEVEKNQPFCSFQPETNEQKAALYAAMTTPDKKIGDFINQKINAVDVFVEMVELTDNDSGEIFEMPRVVIFDKDGTTYTATSKGIYNALTRLIAVYGVPSWDPALPLVIKQITRGDRKFLTLGVDAK